MKNLNKFLLKAVCTIAFLCLLTSNIMSSCAFCFYSGGRIKCLISRSTGCRNWYHDFPDDILSCVDFATIKINPTSDYIHIENEQASFVLDGIKTSIASDAFETYITLINTKYPIGNELDSITRKQMAKELGEFFEKDDGKVSAQSLEKWSKETGLRILDKEPEAARYELTVELFQNNKSIAKTITDASGNFTIKSIPDGEYGLKVTNPTGETPEYFLMTIGGIGTIICCCPGPPCEDPILLYFGTITESKNKTLLVKNNEITATLSYINFKITKGYEK